MFYPYKQNTKIMNAIIVDDEQSGINVMQKLLSTYFPEITVQAVCSNIDEAEAAIRKEAPGILFLDIEMPGGDGFKLLENIGTISFPVVFVTAYNQYAIKALRLSATDYLLKPVNKNDIGLAIEKSKQLYQFRKDNPVNYASVLSNSNTQNNNRVLVINKYTQENVPFRDIVCITADSNYAVIHTLQKKHITVSRPLKELDELLCDESHQFLRIHKSVLIGSIQIEKTKLIGGVLFIELKNNLQFEVSKRKKAEIQTILQKLHLG